MSYRLFMVAGEVSGDRLGGRLLEELKSHHADIETEGVGGEAMLQAGLHSFLPIDSFKVMGFTQILSSLPRLWQQGQQIKKRILETNPDAVILIDYPGFNLRLAKMLRRAGYRGKIIQYGCPTFWAWGKKRKQILIDNYDLLLTLFPFEADHFLNTPLKALFVGHPLAKEVHIYQQDVAWQKMTFANKKVIAIFPGSRKWEVQYNLPLQLAAAKELQQKDPDIVIAVSTLFPADLPQDVIAIDPVHNYDLMHAADAALAKSGTITLELALHGVPTVVTYASSKINKWIAGYILQIRLPYYCMVNILTDNNTFPEFIEKNPTSHELAETVWHLLQDGPEREACLKSCEQLHRLMGERDGSLVAAKAVEEILCGAISE